MMGKRDGDVEEITIQPSGIPASPDSPQDINFIVPTTAKIPDTSFDGKNDLIPLKKGKSTKQIEN